VSEDERKAENAGDGRSVPWGRNAFLAVAFLALVAIAVFTVLLPSLEDAPDESARRTDGGVPSAAEEPASGGAATP